MKGVGLTEPWQIDLFRIKTLAKGLELEIKGMRMSRGRTAYSIIKEEFGLKGNRQTVLEKLNALYEAEMEGLR